MSNLHPTIASALDPFFQAIGAADPAPKPIAPNTPPRKGHERGYWSPPGGRLPDLAVDYLSFSRQWGRRDEWGQMMEPDSPAGVEIQAVWLGQHDIYELLAEDVLSQLEAYFCPEKD